MKTKNILLVGVAGIAILFLGKTYFNAKAKHTEEREIEIFLTEGRNRAKQEIAKMVSRTGAINDWEELLKTSSNGTFRKIPLLTLRLEKLWLDRPILFTGIIKDIATYNKTSYTLLLEKNRYDTRLGILYGTVFQVNLQCPKALLDKFIRDYGILRPDAGIERGNVAVIAKIHHIRGIYNENGDNTKIGEGELIDIRPVESILKMPNLD